MSTPCSLEHCHTNLFSLQSLNDMKWKCFRRSTNYRLETTSQGRCDQYKDPVLLAYWHCLRTDTLCAWRKVQTEESKIERELWLFGINEDLPSDLPNLRPVQQCNGSMNGDSMSYDCRSMLFKALHNMIEKCLLTKGFARLNKWFVLPVNDHSDLRMPNYSFSFNFFLHGDNKVCASVDVQRHRPISTLTVKDLEKVLTNVILAPYGINATFIGQLSRDIDMNNLKDNWERNYPIRKIDGMPDFVEVLAGAVRMSYPTCYIYKVTTNEPLTTTNNESSTNSTSKISPSSQTSSLKSISKPTVTTNNTLSPIIQKLDIRETKKLANNLLISAQRNNCIDMEKKQEMMTSNRVVCSTINDPLNRRQCRCQICSSIHTRHHSVNTIPFHRRPRVTDDLSRSKTDLHSQSSTTVPLSASASSVSHNSAQLFSSTTARNNTSDQQQNIITDNAVASNCQNVDLLSSTIPQILNDKPSSSASNDWDNQQATTTGGPPSVISTTAANSPIPIVLTSTIEKKGLKRSSNVLDESYRGYDDDDENDGIQQAKQTYDFHATDTFLQLPLKRFRQDTDTCTTMQQVSSSSTLPSTTTSIVSANGSDQIYRYGLATPPTPTQINKDPYAFDDEDDSVSLNSKTSSYGKTLETLAVATAASSSTSIAQQSRQQYYKIDDLKPSYADLERIFEVQLNDPNESKTPTNLMTTTISTNGEVRSPQNERRDTMITSTLMTNHITCTTMKPLNNFHGLEEIYATPPGSSSSDKLNCLHSPYTTETVINPNASVYAAKLEAALLSVSSTPALEILKQFNSESIIAQFEPVIIEEQSAYFPLKKISPNNLTKPCLTTKELKPLRYEPTPVTSSLSVSSISWTTQSRHLRWQQQQQQPPTDPVDNRRHAPRSTPGGVGIGSVPSTAISTPLGTNLTYSPMNTSIPSIRSVDSVRSIGSVIASPGPGSVQPRNSIEPYSASAINSISSTYERVAEADSLYFNILLNDSILNIFRDMNFDSCVLCACTPNELSIRGTDATIYLQQQQQQQQSMQQPPSHQMNPHQQPHLPHHPLSNYQNMLPHQQYLHGHNRYDHQHSLPGQTMMPATASTNNHNVCSCGFSAVVNLKLGANAGLFYEDEIEITGIKYETKYTYKTSLNIVEKLSPNLIEMIEKQECLPSPYEYFNTQEVIDRITTTTNDDLQSTTDVDKNQLRGNNSETTKSSSKILKNPIYFNENCACCLAIEQARNVMDNTMLAKDELDKHNWLHLWPYSPSPLDSDQQLIGMLNSLQPLLVDALNKRTVSGLWNSIEGPLTWKHFNQLLYTQNQHIQLDEQLTGPQPIPYVMAGLDRDWLTLAPYGLKFWDKLCLEPYSKAKDIAYICIVPDNDYVCSTTKLYLRELSTNYELCRLGVHRPLLKWFPDNGLLRINNISSSSSQNSDPLSSSTTTTTNLSTSSISVDQWFTDNETHPLGARLKLYAQTLKSHLQYLLQTQTLDHTLHDEPPKRNGPNDISSNTSTTPSSSEMNSDIGLLAPSASPSSTDKSNMNLYANLNSLSTAITGGLGDSMNNNLINSAIDPQDLLAFDSLQQGRTSNDDQLFIVLYIIDTFHYDSIDDNNSNHNDEELECHVKKGILRAYMDLIQLLPEKIVTKINIQIVPFESVVGQQLESDVELRFTQLKRLAFHVYGQLRKTITYTPRAKSLTGFGPAASEEKALTKALMQVYTPAYILSPKSDFRYKSFSDPNEISNNGCVLFCSYCLSDDQRYLLVSCSDDRGELLETCSINIEVTDRHRRKIQHARRIGLQKLWNFIMRIITSTTMPWRIVIGRLGRLGHGEVKSWGVILSKKNLVRCANIIRETCQSCHTLRSQDQPVILSACLISLETHTSLTILPESIELADVRAAGTQGQIVDEVSVTHILTLPTSASVQTSQTLTTRNDVNPMNIANTENDEDFFNQLFRELDPEAEGPPNDAFDLVSPPPPTTDLTDTFQTNIGGLGYHGMNGMNAGNGGRSGNTLTTTNDYNSKDNGLNVNGKSHYDIDLNEIPSLHQQPLALGFYVSTVNTLNKLPEWMLNNSYNERNNKNCSIFKATLHMHIPNAQQSDDMLFQQNIDQKLAHPLDSNFTYVVLRHVLESYNRLSWLLIDPKTNERASCLPIHIETLLRLYHAFVKFV
ncbi:unnamed protein product [Didymodactylos carnosus]|uniref:Mediator of RNA polymerase II transcription subunit 13 n=1 Tax=Didymodactylos carnosus TaxID=1234261 RepID=A0A813XLT3_9BILA|nr:unnamed protein product [Didymodactylos carnosus]CAF0875065.1 unnamed protein product [Didymodactylos carnosus]CAF3520526.1 unnamed protein product [Didymodactylos carnosus]CAF3662019.1 unnamed protein product [Didymodactylos carnosus]